LLSRIGNKKRRSYSFMRKEEDNPIEDKTNLKQVDSIEKKDKIIIDDEVKEYYQNKDKEILTDKLAVENREKIISDQESGLGVYLSDNILINGIIFSEIIALPRALRPFNFHRYKSLR